MGWTGVGIVGFYIIFLVTSLHPPWEGMVGGPGAVWMQKKRSGKVLGDGYRWNQALVPTGPGHVQMLILRVMGRTLCSELAMPPYPFVPASSTCRRHRCVFHPSFLQARALGG